MDDEYLVLNELFFNFKHMTAAERAAVIEQVFNRMERILKDHMLHGRRELDRTEFTLVLKRAK